MKTRLFRLITISLLLCLLLNACDGLPSLPKLPSIPVPFSGPGQLFGPSLTPTQKSTSTVINTIPPTNTFTPIFTKTYTPTYTSTPTSTSTMTPTLTETPSPTPPPIFAVKKSKVKTEFERIGFVFSESDSQDGLPVLRGRNSIFYLDLIGLDDQLTKVSLEFSILGGEQVIQQSVIFLTALFGILIPKDALPTILWVTTQLNLLFEEGKGELEVGNVKIVVENTGDLYRVNIIAIK